ncbi:FtsH protease activity modulator HflK [bacterium endosymbiont of Escarpia laminata]|nr:MAG: FtsH protease activity modulator HflK [bacterium endosymbiont of Escarpia laminata]RLJ20967.1 MAG: FtsH protease activity modulator HflK [bacterium endosymbiont of Escarpia laminata]
MAWNEPGSGNKDPWSGKGGDQGPPDLDEVVKKLQEKFGGMFGGGGGKSNGSDSGGGISLPGGIGIGAIALVLLVIWMATGIYIIEPAERGVILRFGAYSETTQPGPHWHLPYPIEEVYKVNVDQITSFRHKATMLTRDENIVDVELTVQSRIQDAGDYLFQDQNPEKTIRDAIETSVREVIGKSDLYYIMTEGRSAVAAQIKSNAQNMLIFYKTGLEITSVNTQPAKPPEQVKSAFDDAIKAREDKERLENKAEAYANEVVPQARGEAARKVADGKAYRDRVIAEATGEVSRFLAVLKEYEKAPGVTRERLYIDAVETVLSQSSKVMLDTKEGNSLMYLPLDKMMGGGTDTGYQYGGRGGYTPEAGRKQAPATETRDQSRGRRVR